MTNTLRDKPLTQITWADVVAFKQDDLPEGATLEYKLKVPSKDDKAPDVVPSGDEDLGRRAINQIIDEVVAFANAYGGHLIIGVAEDPDRRDHPGEIVPIAECKSFADRLRKRCRDLIDPEVPHLEVQAVEHDETDEGVIIVRVPRSRRAPHMNARTSECFMRHADRTEKMDMREIQRLTLDRVNELTAIDEKFRQRSASFLEWRRTFDARAFVAVQALALPVDELTVAHSTYMPSLQHYNRRIAANIGGKDERLNSNQFVFGSWRTGLRCALLNTSDGRRSVKHERRQDGTIDYRVVWSRELLDESIFYPIWFLTICAYTLRDLHFMRRDSASVSAEYVLQLRIVAGSITKVMPYGGPEMGETLSFVEIDNPFPQYNVGPVDEFPTHMQLIERDFWDAVGIHKTDGFLEIDAKAFE